MAISKVLTGKTQLDQKRVARAWAYDDKNEHGISFGTYRDAGPVDSVGALCSHNGNHELSIDLCACEKQGLPIVIFDEFGRRFRVTRVGTEFPSFLVEESKKGETR